MKHLIILIFACLLAVNIDAQKIKIKKGVVYVDKVAYYKTDCHGFLIDNCIFSSLRGDEVLLTINFEYIRNKGDDFYVCEIIFNNSLFLSGKDYKAQVKMEEVRYRHQIIRALYKYKVIQFGQLDELGVQNFINVYSTDYISQEKNRTTQDTTANKKEYGYQIVERNITRPLVFFGNMIQQDLREIGTYKMEFFDENNAQKQRISFLLNDGTLVATAIMDRYTNDNQCALFTTKDKERRTITVNGLYTKQRVEFLANYLIQRYYF